MTAPILLLGKSGQLGWELHRTLLPLGSLRALDVPEIDLCRPEELRPIIRACRPHIIVNATAYTAVDESERRQQEAHAVNALAPGVMAEEAARCGAALIHYSTDYVFDGSKGSPYRETDAAQPLGSYGWSKLLGEQAIQREAGIHLILRTSWLYSLRRENFVTRVLRWADHEDSLRIVADQVGNPTWARMLAELTAQLLARAGHDPVAWLGERAGLYHVAGWGHASRFHWAQAVLRCHPRFGEAHCRRIVPARTADFPGGARRPLYSALDCSRFAEVFGLALPHWEEALQLALDAACTIPPGR
jgi:dTDP-4-dehydrorhamnose reductase